MFEVDFDAIKEEERRQKGLKRKQKKEKAPFDEVSNDENPFGRRGRGVYQEAEVKDAPVENKLPPNIPSYIPIERLEDDYFKSVNVDARDYPERDVKETVQNVANTSKQVTSIAGVIIMLIAIMIGVTVFLVTRFTMNNSSRSTSTSSQTESPARGKVGASIEPELDYYQLNVHDTTDYLKAGDSVYAGDRMHFRVALHVKNPNPDEWEYWVSIKIKGAKLVEDTSLMKNCSLKDFDRSYMDYHSYSNDVDYNREFVITEHHHETVIIEFSFDVLDNRDELSIKIGSAWFPQSALASSNIMNVSFPII